MKEAKRNRLEKTNAILQQIETLRGTLEVKIEADRRKRMQYDEIVLGLLNTLLRPVLVLLTLPVTLITLGLFLFVINALMFYFAANLLSGFNVTGFTAALIGSLIYSLCSMVIDVAMERLFSSKP